LNRRHWEAVDRSRDKLKHGLRPSKATPDLSQHVPPLPEALRIKGDVLVLSDRSHATAAEDLFRRSLDLARRQKALSWELRTTRALLGCNTPRVAVEMHAIC
jgi:hypothetical protein